MSAADEDVFFFGHARSELDAMRRAAPYLHVIRAPGDPERSAREEDRRLGSRPHHALAKMGQGELQGALWEVLGEASEEGLTFNAMAVMLFDVTADVAAFGALDRALFSLVESGCVAMTHTAPIRFIRTCELEGLNQQAPRHTPQACVQGELEW